MAFGKALLVNFRHAVALSAVSSLALCLASASAQNNLAVFYLTQQPPAVELARWHYEKAVAGGLPRNPDLEKMFSQNRAPEAGE